MSEKTKNIFKWTGIYLLLTLVLFLVYYITLPALNLRSEGFWFFLAFALFLYLSPFSNVKSAFRARVEILKRGEEKPQNAPKGKSRYLIWIAAAPIAVVILGGIISSTFFNARSYAGIITVEEGVFATEMPETENVTNIALMDSSTAAIVGNRTLGSLSDVVSQYEIGATYTQINFRRTPKKVANLEYAGFIKWLTNRKTGIPGYVMVDPVENTAEYVALSEPIRYAESGYFGDDLMRKIRFAYPTKILGEAKYEVDDEGNPVYVVPCYKPRVLLFGASDVSEVILFYPTDGSSTICRVGEVPAWVDVVFDGNLAVEKYNWKGTLSGGFLNSVIGNKDCKQTTDDFGYIVIEDDVWYFTGVTSVNNDRSNIGFIISNARTGEYKYYPVIGAEEHSAMSAAQGEVQEKGYVASFPALINIKGKATYIMVLKDSGGLVKLYALVNVEQYNIVATGATQEEAKNAYLAKLVSEGVLSPEEPPAVPEDETKALTLTVQATTPVTTAGESYLYIRGTDSASGVYLLKKKIAEDERVLLLAEGDTATFTVTPTEVEGVYDILSFEKATP